MITCIDVKKDCTLYKNYETLNTGADEILEVSGSKETEFNHGVARSLIFFEVDHLVHRPSYKYILKAKITEKIEILRSTTLQVFPVYEEWQEGVGRYADMELSPSGACWLYKNSKQEQWGFDQKNNSNHNFSKGIGGSWYEINTQKQEIFSETTFKDEFSDISLDISSIVNLWLENKIENNGILLKFKNENDDMTGTIKLFSRNTNTIYYPHIDVMIDDYTFNPCEKLTYNEVCCDDPPKQPLCQSGSIFTDSESLDSGSVFTDSESLDSGSVFTDSGSLDCELNTLSGSISSGSLINDNTNNTSGSIDSSSSLSSTDNFDFLIRNKLDHSSALNQIQSHKNFVLFVREIKSSYLKNSKERIKVGVREKYPQKKFSNKSQYDLNNFVLNEMFYSLVDTETREIVVDYSNYTKISCNQEGHYFDFDFCTTRKGRTYNFILKVNRNSSEETFVDTRAFRII